jgi:CRP/FNR family cyclic AMP-dependent transcriptional regulator
LHITCRITHNEFGQMVGTTRSRIGYFLKLFEARKMISRDVDTLVVQEHCLIQYLRSRH